MKKDICYYELHKCLRMYVSHKTMKSICVLDRFNGIENTLNLFIFKSCKDLFHYKSRLHKSKYNTLKHKLIT